MEIKINHPPHHGQTIDIQNNSVTILVGKNAAGKTIILQAIKDQLNQEAVLLRTNYENVEGITTINRNAIDRQQIDSTVPNQVASIVAADPELHVIFQFFFKALFESELKIESGQFHSSETNLALEGDGMKSLFNLIYYLISPHKYILLDEPERFLHPSMRGIFISMLSEVARNYEKTIVLSSHSNLSIRFDLDNVEVIHVQKNPSKLTSIKEWVENLSVSEYNDPKQIHQFKDWFYYHTNILFCKNVILVEGVSDQIVLESLRSKLSFQYGLENISINHVASSHHESGGKGRLHKIQSFLSGLLSTIVVADKDVISGSELKKWYSPINGEAEASVINHCESNGLFILPKGEIEDYYFLDPLSEFCTDSTTAKKNKIPAAYEQASMLYRKTSEEIVTQFSDVISIFEKNSTNISAEELLRPIAKKHLVKKYVEGEPDSSHVVSIETQEGAEITFKFTDSAKKFKYSKESLDKLKSTGQDIDSELGKN